MLVNSFVAALSLSVRVLVQIFAALSLNVRMLAMSLMLVICELLSLSRQACCCLSLIAAQRSQLCEIVLRNCPRPSAVNLLFVRSLAV